MSKIVFASFVHQLKNGEPGISTGPGGENL